MTAVLLIGGTDSSGGAGLVQDGRVLAAFGVPARLAVTAVTAQGRSGVLAVDPVSPAMLEAQLIAAARLGPVAAVKIGLVPDYCSAVLLAGLLPQLLPQVPIVLDPVLRASAGGDLGTAEGVWRLWPLATLVTPNLPEAAALLQSPEATDRRAILDQAQALRGRGAGAVLLKGGHCPGARVSDLLLTTTGTRWFTARRLPGERRGTGCALASGIAAGLALGRDLPGAVAGARRWLRASWPKNASPLTPPPP